MRRALGGLFGTLSAYIAFIDVHDPEIAIRLIIQYLRGGISRRRRGGGSSVRFCYFLFVRCRRYAGDCRRVRRRLGSLGRCPRPRRRRRQQQQQQVGDSTSGRDLDEVRTTAWHRTQTHTHTQSEFGLDWSSLFGDGRSNYNRCSWPEARQTTSRRRIIWQRQ